MASEDSGDLRGSPAFPADCPARLGEPPACRIVTGAMVAAGTAGCIRSFQHLAEFIDSADDSLSHDVLNPARVPL
jgi:hypothetical protein